jgi:hypothetical protein
LHDRRDALIRRAAELADCSLRTCSAAAELKAQSEDLAYRLTETQKTGARLLQQMRELRPAAHPGLRSTRRPPGQHLPGAGGGAARVRPQPELHPDTPEAGILGEDEAVTLAALLEELAARHGRDPLSALALQAAALLRHRVAARHRQGNRPGPAARREAGGVRDDDADDRDAQAGQRDRLAGERDDQATERDCRAEAADQEARASEQRVYDLLREAELRDQAAAGHAAAPPPAGQDALRQQWQLDREMAGADRARNQGDREAIREMLSQARGTRHAARDGRYASGRDRLASRRDRLAAQADRQDAIRDRQAAGADRDQAVIENEEQEALWD